MNILWPFLLSFIAGISTILGTVFLFVKTRKNDEFITYTISLSLSIMLMISVFDLIPEAMPYILSQNTIKGIILFITFFTMGNLLVNFINSLIKKGEGSSLLKIGILNFVALIIHNVPEGILTFMGAYHDFKLGLTLTIAIALHNIPEGISIAVPVYYATKSRGKAFFMVLLSALAEPIGALLAFIGLKSLINDATISFVLILTAGIMITLSINKMLPEALKYKKNKPMIYGLLTGIIIVIMSLII